MMWRYGMPLASSRRSIRMRSLQDWTCLFSRSPGLRIVLPNIRMHESLGILRLSDALVRPWKVERPMKEIGLFYGTHYLTELSFILLAGMAASIMQKMAQYPPTEIQNTHLGQLASQDYAVQLEHRFVSICRLYYHAYEKTFEQCQ